MPKKNTKTAIQEAEENGQNLVDTDVSAAGPDEEVEVDEGQVVDLVTSEPVKLSSKEQIRQEEERKLLEEFSYPEQHKKDLIRINFSVKPQQGKARRLPLVVLRPVTNGSTTKPYDRVYILIDIQSEKTRADDPKNGSEALAELLRDTAGAEFGVWTNGTERIVYWKESGRIKIRTKLVSDIPRFGEGPEKCFTLDKQALRPAGGLSLRQAFQRCHDHIYANRGGSNEAVFWEFLKVVFAKIQDERRLQQATTAGKEEERLFRIASLEERNDEKKAEAVKQRLEQLYTEVRKAYPELFGTQADEIDLSAPILSYVVAQLELYNFLESSVDVKGEAYEAIVGKNLQGTRGEFFTPRNAVKLGIRILDPKPGDKCIDPACGTAGFIVVIMNYIAERLKREMINAGKDPEGKDRAKYNLRLRLASQTIFGLDINPNLVKVARMNMVMNNDGQGGITHVNSLERSEAWRFALGKRRFFKTDGSTAEEALEAFFRRELAEGTVRDAEDGRGVIEVVDLHDHRAEVVEYVQSYLDLLSLKQKVGAAAGPGGINNVLADYAQIMRIDSVLLIAGASDDPMGVLLLAPTHPLRVMWLYQYQSYVRAWIQQMSGKDPNAIKQLISEDSIDKIVDLNIPNAIAWNQDRVFINTDNLDLFWSVLPSAGVADLRTAVNAALQAIGAGRKEVVISTVTPGQLADKMTRYLAHHPYVRTLKINVINPGDASVLLEAMERLIADDLYHEINFELKFFSPPGTKHHLVGSAFDDLMEFRDDRDYSAGGDISEQEEYLLQPNANPLFPKLIYAKHNIEDLLQDEDGRFESHLTLVIDYFGTTVATRAHTGPPDSSALHNLIAEYVTDYTPGKTTATWSRLVAPNQCPPLISDGNTERLYQCQDLLSVLASSFFDWGRSLDKRITIQLELTDEHGKNHLKMLRKAHLTSDWVFTIDRNFGIEYYDDPTSGPAGESGGYLIDYTPEFLDAISHRLIISTYHQHEIESILKRGFSKLLDTDTQEGPAIESYQIGRILQVLKSVSGKLALKLINNPNQAQEVIGLALTRMILERDGRLVGAVLIPVDSHIRLFHQTPKELENSELTLKRTDLILARLDDMYLNLDLIEVKNYKYASPQKLLELQAAIRDKNKNTEAHFNANFLSSPALRRLDAEIKNKELATILAFYFDRANRYRLFAPANSSAPAEDVAAEFRESLEAVEAGVCQVRFHHYGYIFNSNSLNEEEKITFQNNQVTVVGRPGIAKLLDLMIDGNGDEPGPEEPPPSTGPPPEVPPAPPAPKAGGGAPPQAPPPPPAPAVREVAAPSTSGASGTALPHAPEDELNIFLGTNAVTGQPAYWNPYTTKPRKLSNQHVLVVGKSGAGKSETTKALVWELARRNVPSIIFDYQGEYAAGEFFEAVKPQVFDVMRGLPINPFELPIDPLTGRKRPYIEMVFRLADTLNSVFAGSGDIQMGTLREAIDLCYQQHGFDRDNAESWNNEPPTIEMLEAVLAQLAADRGAQVKNLQVRLQPLFKSGIFRKKKAEFEFDQLFEKTTVLLLTAGIKDLMLAASRFILEKVYSAMLMAGVSKRLRVMAVIDEAHKLCGDGTVTSLIKEARKYGMGIILSSQETRDFHPSVFANTGTLVGLALEEEDANVMSKYMGLTDRTERNQAKELLLYQANGQALIRSQHFLPYAHVKILSFEDRLSRLASDSEHD